MNSLCVFATFVLLLPIAAVHALVLSPSACVSYAYASWRKTITHASDSGSGSNKNTVIYPTMFNVSEAGDGDGGWEWISAASERPPASATQEQEQDSLSLIHINTIEFQCHAPYPIEWIYEGDGWSEENEAILRQSQALEEVRVQNSRSRSRNDNGEQLRVRRPQSEDESLQSPEDDSRADHFTSRITGLKLYELISGEYKCRSIAFPEVFVSLNVFVPNNTVLDDDDSSPAVIPSRTFLLESSQTIWFNEKDAQVRIPCSVSDPKAVVTLHELYDDGSDSGIRVELPFDPRKGFFVPSSHISWKRYKCSVKDRKKSLEVFLFRESASKTPYFSVAPKDTIVLLKPNQTQTFRCEGYRPISIETSMAGGSGSGGSSSSCGMGTVRTRYSFHPQNHYPYRAIVEVNVTPTRDSGNPGAAAAAFMDIVCRTEDGQQALHTWEVIRHDSTAAQTWTGLQLKFDQSRQRIECSSGSGRKPNLRVIQCGSPIECRMRRQYLLKLHTLEIDGVTGSSSNDHCLTVSFPDDRITEGLLTCDAGTQSKENYFIYNGYTKSGALHATDQEWVVNLNSTTVIGLNALREQTRTRTVEATSDDGDESYTYTLPLGEIYFGGQASFKCAVPRQVFATDDESVIWGFKHRNGTTRQIDVGHGARGVDALLEFDDLNIEAVTCRAPLLHSFDWVTLEMPVEVRPAAAKVAPALEFRHSKNAVVTAADAEEDNRSLVLSMTPATAGQRQGVGGGLSEVRLELLCQAGYPVEWVYQAGEGSPVFIQTATLRDMDNFTATLVLGAQEQNSGRYECRRINDHSQSAFYDVYVPGLSLFLTPATTGELEFEFHGAENATVDATWAWFRIPCAVSNPSASVKLMTLNREKNAWTFVASSKQAPAPNVAVGSPVSGSTSTASNSFSPLLGFNVSSKTVESTAPTPSQSQEEPVFKCMSIDGRRSSANFTRVQGRRDDNDSSSPSSLISASPSSHFVRANAIASQATEQHLHFECKSSAEIKIRFPGMSGRNFSAYNVTHVHDPASSTYTAGFTLTLGGPGGLAAENYTHIQCVEKKTDKLLYYWEYTIYNYNPNLITSFEYVAENRSYECCARDGVSATAAELVFLPCATVTECRTQRACLARPECHNRRARWAATTSGGACASIQVTNTSTSEPAPVSGVLHCAVDGFVSRQSKSYVFYTDGLNYEVHTDKWALELGDGIPTSAILKIKLGSGSVNRIECYASKMFFADGLRFGLEYGNGSLVYQKPDERLTPTPEPQPRNFEYSASLTLQTLPGPDSNLALALATTGLQKVYCFASDWKSSQWRNTSISISEGGQKQKHN